jgi:catechol 2,3-dioxygenase-like lactoylglutathione lyase family enzyme
MSLTTSPVAVMLPITDAGRSQQFYGDRLGLAYDGTNGDGELAYRLGGGAQLVLRVLPDAKPSLNTTMSFRVDDVSAEIAELEQRGVKFEDYDEPGFSTVGHVFESDGMRAAWFLDPDANVLCLHELTG